MKDQGRTTINQDLLVNHNKSCILHTIWENKGISRLEIARHTNLSTATISRMVDSLINDDKLIVEKGNITNAKGRPMKSLFFAGNGRYIIGIDLGTTYIRGMLTNMNAEPIKEIEVVSESWKSPEYVLNKVVDVIERLSDTNIVNQSEIVGVGIAVAGIVNLNTGVVEYSPAFNWRDINLREFMEARVKIPVFFDNVSRVMALGELTFGDGNKYNNIVCVNVGYGIGAGIIIQKKLYYGTDGMAGEFGHVPIEGDELIICPCGKKTCLTSYSSGDAIARRTKLILQKKNSDILMKLCQNNIEELTAKMVIEAAEQKDKIASEIFLKSVKTLGASIAGLINIFNPEAVFIGGGVALNGEIFWKPLKDTIQEYVFDQRSTKCHILPVTYKQRAAIYGAVGLITNAILNRNI
jgi:glucokinase-like ROK family protein